MVVPPTMESQSPKASPSRPLALRFISGKYQGGEFPLPVGTRAEIIVGRSSELDMVLVEDMVSRRHARIECDDDHILIEDLGSTNGTFVNGEKIKRAALKEGDRVLIGTSILKVVSTDPGAPPRRREDMQSAGMRGTTRTMTGAIDEIPLPDLLQLFGSSKKSGVLIVRSEDDIGKIFLKKGVVTFASINDLETVPPLKSIFRILTWTQGSFELGPPDEREIPGQINASVQELLMEGLRQIDELNLIRDKLPPLDAHLTIAHPLDALLRDLGPLELDMLQLAWNHQTLAAVLNQSLVPDLDTARTLLGLIERGYLRAE
jgi:pSer/pThr/pTyr-binding forkhead associated (FHA) protein